LLHDIDGGVGGEPEHELLVGVVLAHERLRRHRDVRPGFVGQLERLVVEDLHLAQRWV